MVTSTGCGLNPNGPERKLTRHIFQVNVLVSDEGAAQIADFGLSIFSEATASGATTTTAGPKGTVAWMSPERLNSGLRLAPPMDIYSFGILWLAVRVVAFHKLVGD
jgi:serine/threonine protein kinase